MVNFLCFIFGIKWRFKRWKKERIRKYQQKQTKNLVEFAVENSSFYKEYYQGYDLDNFSSLPFMNKNLFMDNFTAINTKGLTKEECMEHCIQKEKTRDFDQYYKGYLVGLSTGTSGNRGLEFVTKSEAFLMKIMTIMRFPFPSAFRYHLAFILRVFSPGFGYNGLRFKVSYVNPLNPKEKMIQELNELEPNIISAPPSILQLLARSKRKNKLDFAPLLIVSYAEVLTTNVREGLEDTFNCPVMEAYKSSESFIALPCKEGYLHINEDSVYVEVLDKNNIHVKPGNPGFVVITDLIKHGTPLIRYKMNDLITISPKKCPCGSNFRVIEKIHGRADDIILGYNPTSDEKELILPDFLRRSVVTASNQIREYNVIQHETDKIEVILELDENTTKEEQKKIEKEIAKNIHEIFMRHGCVKPDLNFIYKTEIKLDPDKKLRRVRRTFTNDFRK